MDDDLDIYDGLDEFEENIESEKVSVCLVMYDV